MCGEVGDAAHSIALHFDVRREHLSNEGLKTTEFDNKQLVLGYHDTKIFVSMFFQRQPITAVSMPSATDLLLTAKLPKAAEAAR